jgi:hypothetical protein
MASKAKPPTAVKTAVKGPNDFHGTHNQSVIVPARFKAGIKAMGVNGWMYYNDFLREYKINPAQGALHRKGFEDHMLEADKKMVICGSVKLAKSFRESI